MGSQPAGQPWPSTNRLQFESSAGASFHAYLHIPFCLTRCGYCDFNTYTASELPGVSQQSFHEVLSREIDWSRQILASNELAPRQLATIFFGGGTPSQLHHSQIAHLIERLHSNFGIAADAEVTMEANPDDLNSERLAHLKAAGVNRISLGVQSFDSEVLQTLERRHDAKLVPEVVSAASELGFRTSIDLIFGAPGESLESWHETLLIARELPVEHVSAYALIVEPGTKLHRQVKSGQLVPQDDDLLAEKYWLADQILGQRGFSWYEVSNFTRGQQSQHNLAYWQSQDWWGFGPGAHSHIGGVRWWNTKHPSKYGEQLRDGSPAAGYEVLSQEQRDAERVMLAMRLEPGILIQDLSECGVSRSAIEAEVVAGNLDLQGDRVSLTRQSRFLADGLVLRLLTESEA